MNQPDPSGLTELADTARDLHTNSQAGPGGSRRVMLTKAYLAGVEDALRWATGDAPAPKLHLL